MMFGLIDCLYADKCSGYPYKCHRCKKNKENKEDYFEPKDNFPQWKWNWKDAWRCDLE